MMTCDSHHFHITSRTERSWRGEGIYHGAMLRVAVVRNESGSCSAYVVNAEGRAYGYYGDFQTPEKALGKLLRRVAVVRGAWR